MKSVLALLPFLVSSLLSSPLDRRDNGPDTKGVYIEALKYGGTGCPQGTIGQSISDDRTTFTLIFDNYSASIGEGVSITENRKNCQVNLAVRFPQGWQFSLLNSDFRGFIALDQGVTATQKSTYYFSGDSKQCSAEVNFTGPVSKDYLAHNEFGVQSTVWCACGASAMLNINGQVRLMSTNPKASGLFSNDSQDGSFKNVLKFSWRKCH